MTKFNQRLFKALVNRRHDNQTSWVKFGQDFPSITVKTYIG